MTLQRAEMWLALRKQCRDTRSIRPCGASRKGLNSILTSPAHRYVRLHCVLIGWAARPPLPATKTSRWGPRVTHGGHFRTSRSAFRSCARAAVAVVDGASQPRCCDGLSRTVRGGLDPPVGVQRSVAADHSNQRPNGPAGAILRKIWRRRHWGLGRGEGGRSEGV